MSTIDLSLRALFAHQSGNAYAITHRFDSIDLLNVKPPRKHEATDVGNFGMNDPIKAVSRRGRGLWHYDGAIGYEDDLGEGWTLERWHLNATLSAGLSIVLGRADVGDWTDVEVGQIVGRTGNTGARLPDGRPMPAHTHIVLKHNGVPVDVERYLLGAPFSTGTPQEDTMRFRGSKVNVVTGAPTYRLTANANFRAGPARDTETLAVLPLGTELHPAYEVEGEAIGTNDRWLEARGYIASAELSAIGFVHTSVTERIGDPPPLSADEIQRIQAAANEAGFIKGRDAAVAAAAVVTP